MSDLKQAAQQALEALCLDAGDAQVTLEADAINALRAALEQPEQEPVAWMVYTEDGKSVCVTDNPADFVEWRSLPLYTHPPRREWRGLTEEEIVNVLGNVRERLDGNVFVGFARIIEAALKEKNTG